MTDREKRLAELLTALGHKPLNRAWAKAELFFGLTTAGFGLLFGAWAVTRPADILWGIGGVGLIMFVHGSYLALAGHRSHLYQSNNELAALLLEHLRRLEGKG